MRGLIEADCPATSGRASILVAELPRTDTGKLQRFRLREWPHVSNAPVPVR